LDELGIAREQQHVCSAQRRVGSWGTVTPE
jgi:hypothetical protein